MTVLRELLERTGRYYKLNGSPFYPGLHKRHQEAGVEKVLLVLRFKAEVWANDPKMQPYLRPKTLFGPENFREYLAEAECELEKGGAA